MRSAASTEIAAETSEHGTVGILSAARFAFSQEIHAPLECFGFAREIVSRAAEWLIVEGAVVSQTPDVQSIIAEVLRGNRDAFRRLVDRYALPLRSYIASQVYRTDDVDDLAQEVFIAAYRALHKFRAGEDFAAWLRGIARNEVLMYFRNAARREAALDRFRAEVARAVEADLDQTAAADRTEAIERLLLCIAQLPERLRRVVRAGLNGDTVVTLATELETTAGAIYNLHYRANRMLRTCLEQGAG